MLKSHEELAATNECCEITCINQNIVEEVREKLPDEETLYDLAELFKVFGDSTRIKILCALFESEMCVCDIATLLNMTQSAISHQLRVLKTNKLFFIYNVYRRSTYMTDSTMQIHILK